VIVTRRAVTAALSASALFACCEAWPLRLVGTAFAQSAAAVAQPTSLPDMALGPADAPVTIVEYASLTCPHCAYFNREIFPRIKSAYIDTGKIRYVFREFPRDIKDAAGAMLARSIAKDDCAKYFAIIDILFRQQDELLEKTTETLTRVGKQAGLSQQAVETSLKDQALLDKLSANRKFAIEVLKIPGTPTFFLNGAMIKGVPSFEDLETQIKPLLKS
jgi:protein-disulfide isomerase